MRKYVIIVFTILIIVSCKEEKKTYYSNGSLKSKFTLKRGKINGEYKVYYKNGNLKEIHNYFNGKKIDSSIYYKNNKQKKIERISKFLNDSVQYNIHYDSLNNLLFEGKSIHEKLRIGNWTFYKKAFDSIVEYISVNSVTYPNQIWSISKSKDTLGLKSNYFDLYMNDTVGIDELLRVSINLVEPFYSYDSDLEVLIPSNDDDLMEDYSNLNQVKLDTFKSLKNDGISNVDIPKGLPINHIAEFGLKYSKQGKKRLRGVIVEYQIQDSLRIERRLFFEKNIIVIK